MAGKLPNMAAFSFGKTADVSKREGFSVKDCNAASSLATTAKAVVDANLVEVVVLEEEVFVVYGFPRVFLVQNLQQLLQLSCRGV